MSEATHTDLDIREQVERIDRLREEARKFAVEQHKLAAKAHKLERDRAIIPWQIMATLLGAGAALFGAGAAFVKVLWG